ncbi:MAG: citramalate synthase, partial [Desulfobacteraceae bacterium]|nr:citramalate synthase [Desulfobacteraceae bacterium]
IGIHYIEGGWPGSNPGAEQFFKLAKEVEFKNAKIAAFGSTRHPNKNVDNDDNLQALIKSEAPVVTIFGKSWDLHVEKVMNNSKENNLAMITESIEYLFKHDREVIYDAEHFFDGYKSDPTYALETLKAAIKGNSKTIVLCDTNGGTLPSEITKITKAVTKHLKDSGYDKIDLGIHAHNDCAMAVANSVAAVEQGVSMVQGTINGYGERCGNTDLTSMIPILCKKLGIECMSDENLKNLLSLSRFVSEAANIPPLGNRPFVGKSAFAHKGGIHVSAVNKIPKAYEHMDPEIIGNHRRVLVSEQSGRSNIEYKAKELGVDLKDDRRNGINIVSNIKELENYGYEFDIADGSLKLLMEKLTGQFSPKFELESFRVSVEKDRERPCYSHAMIKVKIGDNFEITSAEGDGPVSALDNALRKALTIIYPKLNNMQLVDFKVRVIDGIDGTNARVRVLIESRDENTVFTTVGVSEDIIEASWQALADSFQYKLAMDNQADDQIGKQ